MANDLKESPGDPGLSFHQKFQDLIRIPYVILMILLLIVIGFGFLHPDSYGELIKVWSGKKTAVCLAAGIFVFLCPVLFLSSFIIKLKHRQKAIVIAALSILGIILQIALIVRYPIQIWWDNTSVLSSAISVVTRNKEYFDYDYFNQLGHQNCFLLLTVILVKISDLLHISKEYITLYFSLIDMIAIDTAALLSVLTVKRIKGADAAVRVFVFILLCPGMYLWAGYYYTTNMSLTFMSLYLYLVCRAWDREKTPVYYILLGLLTGFGCQFRATMLIAVIATVAYAFFRLPAKPLRAFLCTAAGALFCVALLNLSYEKMIPDYDKEARFPVTHWLMMAAQGNGEYNDADLAFTDSFPTRKEKEEATKNEYIRRLKEMGPLGIAKLCVRKTVHNFSYGNHSYYPLFHRYDRISDFLWTPDHQVMFYIEQVYNLAMLLMVLASVLLAAVRRKAGEKVCFDALVQILMTGGFFFYMLWETYPYYSVGFLMVFLYLSADGLGFLEGFTVSGFGRKGVKPGIAGKLAPVVLCFAAALFVILILSNTSWPDTVKPVVTQKKYNKMIYMNDAKKLSQTFTASRDFDTITFWVTKQSLDDAAGGQYEITLTGQRLGQVYSEHYDTADMTRIDEFTRTIPVVRVSGSEVFTLSIEAVSGNDKNPLGVGAFGMPVEAYMYGDLYKDGTRQDEEMFFTVTCGGPDGVIRLYD